MKEFHFIFFFSYIIIIVIFFFFFLFFFFKKKNCFLLNKELKYKNKIFFLLTL